METGWRGRERRLKGAGSLQGQGPRIGATRPRDDQRSGLGGEVRSGLGQQKLRQAEELTNYECMGVGGC